jgi:hypothetical protein
MVPTVRSEGKTFDAAPRTCGFGDAEVERDFAVEFGRVLAWLRVEAECRTGGRWLVKGIGATLDFVVAECWTLWSSVGLPCASDAIEFPLAQWGCSLGFDGIAGSVDVFIVGCMGCGSPPNPGSVAGWFIKNRSKVIWRKDGICLVWCLWSVQLTVLLVGSRRK